MPKPITILSLDGGGIHGIIPAMMLAEIEARTGWYPGSLFDFIAGTATGGIIALTLVRPNGNNLPKHTAADVVELYEAKAREIFGPPTWSARFHDAVRSWLFATKQRTDRLQRVFEGYLGDARLRSAVSEVLVHGYDLEVHIPRFFKRHKACADPAQDFPLMTVARATAMMIEGAKADNPAMCAFAEARKLHRSARDFVVVSLGTGTQTAAPASERVHYQLKNLLPGSAQERRYYRFQPELPSLAAPHEETSRANVVRLRNFAAEYIRAHDAEIDQVCEHLLETKYELATMAAAS